MKPFYQNWRDWVCRPSLWLEFAGFRCTDAAVALGKTWPYAAGLLHIQEEVSMLPVHALAPEPGECVLDLCAAPGIKQPRWPC